MWSWHRDSIWGVTSGISGDFQLPARLLGRHPEKPESSCTLWIRRGIWKSTCSTIQHIHDIAVINLFSNNVACGLFVSLQTSASSSDILATHEFNIIGDYWLYYVLANGNQVKVTADIFKFMSLRTLDCPIVRPNFIWRTASGPSFRSAISKSLRSDLDLKAKLQLGVHSRYSGLWPVYVCHNCYM